MSDKKKRVGGDLFTLMLFAGLAVWLYYLVGQK